MFIEESDDCVVVTRLVWAQNQTSKAVPLRDEPPSVHIGVLCTRARCDVYRVHMVRSMCDETLFRLNTDVRLEHL